MSQIDDSQLRRYLLGQLDEDAREKLEEEFFRDDQVFHRLEPLEEELMEDYAAGNLGDLERASFQQRFLSTEERKRRSEVIAELHRKAALEKEVPSTTWEMLQGFFRLTPPAFKFAAAAALLLAVILPTGLGLRLASNNRDLARLRARTEIATLTLRPQLRSGEAAEPFNVPDAAQVVRVELELGPEAADFSRYRVALRDTEGNETLRLGVVAPMLGADSGKISFELPVSWLREGQFLIEVEASADGDNFEPLRTFSFRVKLE